MTSIYHIKFEHISFSSNMPLNSQSLWQSFTSHINQCGYLGLSQTLFNKLLIMTFSIQCHLYWLWFNRIYRVLFPFSTTSLILNILYKWDKILSVIIVFLTPTLILFIAFARTFHKAWTTSADTYVKPSCGQPTTLKE